MGFNMDKMMKQAQKMQADMARIQEELAEKVIEVQAGGGAIKIQITGGQEIRGVTLSPEIVDPEDIEMLQDMMVAAFNEAVRASQDMAKEELSRITGGMKLPGMPGF